MNRAECFTFPRYDPTEYDSGMGIYAFFRNKGKFVHPLIWRSI
jgi:hypothetical protein